jgi:ADP-heptose:LPS heptosyltransferase
MVAGAASAARRWRGLFRRRETVSQIVRNMIARANRARDTRDYRDAAVLYDEALRIRPGNAAIHVQCGHMFKEAGDLANAERHYLEADRLMPNDADLALQLGHFYKVAGRWSHAESAYRRALQLMPHWSEPASELEQLQGQSDAADLSPTNGLADMVSRLVPELAPRKPHELRRTFVGSIHIRRLGARRERSSWGVLPTLRGVQAIRGFCVSSDPIVDFQIAFDRQIVYKGPLQGHAIEGGPQDQLKYVFNIWHDFSNFTFGRYTAELRFVDKNNKVHFRREQVVVAGPLTATQFPDSDALVSLSDTDSRSADEQINSRPSVVRPAKREPFQEPIRNVLVQRTDQLGDMVSSISAMRRLRVLLPNAHMVGLLTSANAEFARTLALFDEIIVVDFPDDEVERRRIMPLDKQEQLRKRLEPFKFDIAIDLAESPVSRPLLLLSGAPFLIGFKDDRSPWLSAFYEGWMVDPIIGRQAVPVSAKTLGLVEWLGTILGNSTQIIRRDGLGRDQLVPYGLAVTDRFAVLHTGARLKFSQWPHYDKLASMILAATDLKVVMISDDPLVRPKLALELTASDRFQFLDKRLPFDDFDALLSFCAVFVGNDSGPSHLASLRGTNVVNLFLARHNWNEWGHENRGCIISRKVPCAGCDIYFDPEECGKGFACIVNISPEEVFDAIMTLL